MARELVLNRRSVTLDIVKEVRDFCCNISGQLVGKTCRSGKVLKRRVIGIWEELAITKRSVSIKREPFIDAVADADLSNIAENRPAHEEY